MWRRKYHSVAAVTISQMAIFFPEGITCLSSSRVGLVYTFATHDILHHKKEKISIWFKSLEYDVNTNLDTTLEIWWRHCKVKFGQYWIKVKRINISDSVSFCTKVPFVSWCGVTRSEWIRHFGFEFIHNNHCHSRDGSYTNQPNQQTDQKWSTREQQRS